MNEEVLLRLLDGELTENEAERARRHLRGCALCTARAQGLERTIDELKAPMPDIDPAADIEAVMQRLPSVAPEARALQLPSRAARWSLVVGLAAAFAVSATVVLPALRHPASDDPAAFAARGKALGTSTDRGVAVTVREGARDLTAGALVRPDAAYTVNYRNLLRVPVHLLAFAVDAAGTVHWLCPAYTEPTSNPPSAMLSPETNNAGPPCSMQFDAPAAGPLRFMAVLSVSPMRVRDVDTLHGGDLETAALRARWPNTDIRELVTVHVDLAP